VYDLCVTDAQKLFDLNEAIISRQPPVGVEAMLVNGSLFSSVPQDIAEFCTDALQLLLNKVIGILNLNETTQVNNTLVFWQVGQVPMESEWAIHKTGNQRHCYADKKAIRWDFLHGCCSLVDVYILVRDTLNSLGSV
jgi:hypothetical protein